MGNGNYIICQKCEYEREFLLGSGMMWGNIENIIGFMDKSSKEEASKILQENPDPHYKTDGNCVYQCQKCFSLREKIHLLIYDKDGKIAFQGCVDKKIIDSYLSDPYYNSIPPKSLDVNNFNLNPISNSNLENSVATLSELTALTIVNSLNFFKKKPQKIILCGGGRKNKYIHERIKKTSNISTICIDEYEIDGDFIESQAFAYLAIRSLLRKTISFPGTTGVTKPVTGGKLVETK